MASARESLTFDQRFNLWHDDADEWEALARYGNWRQSSDGAYAEIPNCGGSDYSGSLVERSNFETWEKTFAEGEGQWWKSVHGSHGTFAIVARIADLTDEACEFICALENYPSIDDSHLSELETEAQDESWDNWARQDFARAIAKRFNVDIDLDVDTTRELLWEVFRSSCDHSNTYWENQSGGDMYIDLARVVASVTTEEFDELCSAARDDADQLELPLIAR